VRCPLPLAEDADHLLQCDLLSEEVFSGDTWFLKDKPVLVLENGSVPWASVSIRPVDLFSTVMRDAGVEVSVFGPTSGVSTDAAKDSVMTLLLDWSSSFGTSSSVKGAKIIAWTSSMNSTALSWAESRYLIGSCQNKMQETDTKCGQENPLLS